MAPHIPLPPHLVPTPHEDQEQEQEQEQVEEEEEDRSSSPVTIDLTGDEKEEEEMMPVLELAVTPPLVKNEAEGNFQDMDDYFEENSSYHSWGRDTPGAHPAPEVPDEAVEEAVITTHQIYARRHSGSLLSRRPSSACSESPRATPYIIPRRDDGPFRRPLPVTHPSVFHPVITNVFSMQKQPVLTNVATIGDDSITPADEPERQAPFIRREMSIPRRMQQAIQPQVTTEQVADRSTQTATTIGVQTNKRPPQPPRRAPRTTTAGPPKRGRPCVPRLTPRTTSVPTQVRPCSVMLQRLPAPVQGRLVIPVKATLLQDPVAQSGAWTFTPVQDSGASDMSNL
jgi:hypothetical protein